MFQLQLSDRNIEYIIKKHARAKRIRITIKRNQEITVTIPRYVSYKAGEAFVREKQSWIEKAISGKAKSETVLPQLADWQKYKASTQQLVETMIRKYQELYPFKYKSIAIKNQSGRWGSCSSKGRLNFNYRLQFIPTELAEYVVVHELCHLKQMNHSPRFWALVAKAFPNYQALRKSLRQIHY